MNEATLFRTLMDQLPDAVYFKDLKGRFVRINRVLAAWHGLDDPRAAVGKTEADFTPRGFAQATEEAEAAIRRTGVPIVGQEEKIVGRDGKTHWVSTTKVPVRGPRGRIIGTMGISRDIRGVKRAEEQTRDSEAVYQSLIESLPQCIFRKDADGRYVYVNHRLCDLLGVPPEKMLGKTDLDVNPPHLAAKYRRDDQWVMAHQKVFEAVEHVQSKKRKKIRIRIHKTPVYDSKGRVVGVQGVFSPV